MLGMIWYRSKVLSVLKQQFGYEPAVPGWQAPVFNGLTREIKQRGGNEYDGAIAFMLAQIQARDGSLDAEAMYWRTTMRETVSTLLPRAKLQHGAL